MKIEALKQSEVGSGAVHIRCSSLFTKGTKGSKRSTSEMCQPCLLQSSSMWASTLQALPGDADKSWKKKLHSAEESLHCCHLLFGAHDLVKADIIPEKKNVGCPNQSAGFPFQDAVYFILAK